MPPQDPEQAAWFERELRPHEPMLRAWLASRFPELRDVDDILQEAYTRVLAARAGRELQSPKAFLFATARNLACDQFRRTPGATHVPLGDGEGFSVLDETADIVEAVARNQEIELMTEAIQALPDRCRQVLTLRNVYGLSQKEIAAQMGISVSTVEVQITAGIKRCTEFVARRLRRSQP